MTLEKWSQVAGIVAVPVSIFVPILLWYFGPKEAKAFLKRRRGLLITLISVFALLSGWFSGWFRWLFHPFTLPVWALVLLFGLGVLLTLAIWAVVYLVTKPPPPEARADDWHNFVTDEIFGVIWQWSFNGDTLNESRLVAYCPTHECFNSLKASHDQENPNLFRGIYPLPDTLKCYRCGFKRHFDLPFEALKDRVTDEIVRLIQTGQYKNRLGRNANKT